MFKWIVYFSVYNFWWIEFFVYDFMYYIFFKKWKFWWIIVKNVFEIYYNLDYWGLWDFRFVYL